MESLFTPILEPGVLPAVFPSPFDELGPAPIARHAAELLLHDLSNGRWHDTLAAADLFAPGGGKMFGVLIAADAAGRLGYLRAFSGMLAGRWDVEGFVPPMFDRGARSRIEAPGEQLVRSVHQRRIAFANSEELARARAERDAIARAAHDALQALRHVHAARKQQRRARRAFFALTRTPDEVAALLRDLERSSRADKAERRQLAAAMAEETARGARAAMQLERRLAAHDRLSRIVARHFMRAIHDCYAIPRGARPPLPLRRLYHPGEPPSGAGDCAAPKLLAFALARGLRPVALAEFWVGAPPLGGGRTSGAFYPACRDKCGPLLPALLEGLDVAPPRRFAPPPAPPSALHIVHADRHLVVVDKPAGLLSVPGREAGGPASLLDLLRDAFPQASGPLLVHRLDLDTSGLLVAALDLPTFIDLQKQFLSRSVDKRYIAWLDGLVEPESGCIDLALRVDLDDRPRQIHDPLHGKPARTLWRRLDVQAQRTRVELVPLTGRTHQLRVHAAHPLGLHAPIVGDRLYGRGGDRLLLHAASLTLRHPASGDEVTFTSRAPF